MSRAWDGRASRDEYYERIGDVGLAPLWERLTELLPAEPQVRSQPHRWDYAALRPLLLESAAVVGKDEAERRVLILENPGLAGESAITEALFAGFQLMMPGEIAPPHRHSPAALRFILESDSAYTTVNGERFEMRPGDLILTPSWSWHGHGHEGEAPVVWLDVLDLPAVRSLGPRFAERRARREPEPLLDTVSPYRYGMQMAEAPASGENAADGRRAGPLLRYDYARSREALARLQERTELDPACGVRMEYITPSTGGPVLPTISAFLQLLPAGFSGAVYRTSEGIVYCVAEGSGRVKVGAGPDRFDIDYRTNDVIAVPCWQPHAFAAAEETVLFSASDRAMQAGLGIWREQRW